ncbi:hypothetical protein L6452_02688 [Arctium lappa]|uniref:Uncharacterized protein n=1 Tax=Arctium lappa TaxID=4217 RepID=A0ACB9FKR3_ARCLA|nr:hypothetical protein L6452_02688 [Arctium lappa]
MVFGLFSEHREFIFCFGSGLVSLVASLWCLKIVASRGINNTNTAIDNSNQSFRILILLLAAKNLTNLPYVCVCEKIYRSKNFTDS